MRWSDEYKRISSKLTAWSSSLQRNVTSKSTFKWQWDNKISSILDIKQQSKQKKKKNLRASCVSSIKKLCY